MFPKKYGGTVLLKHNKSCTFNPPDDLYIESALFAKKVVTLQIEIEQ